MAVEDPSIQMKITDDSGLVTRVWALWFHSISRETKEGFSGTFTNGDGDTVTVVNGKITDVS